MQGSSWSKSTRSGSDGACVEVRDRAEAIDVRDSKAKGGPALAFTHRQWQVFIAAIRDGKLGLG